MALVEIVDWSLIPGPLRDPPPSSGTLEDIETYAPERVAETLLALPGVALIHSADPSWWDWRARWTGPSGWLDIGFTLFDVEPVAWGGSALEGVCELEDAVALVRALRAKLPGVWLHNGACGIHSPESFAGSVAVRGGG